jgi:hypothetical protein
MWPTDVCTSLRGKTEPVGFDNVVYVLRYGDSASDLQVVIKPAKKEIVAKVEILFSAVADDWVRESSAQTSPMLCTLLPSI